MAPPGNAEHEDASVGPNRALAVQTSDGKIHLTFTSHERAIVNRAVLDEDWTKHGGQVKSWLPQ